MLPTVLRTLSAPLSWYNSQLSRRPFITKSLTSGLMFGLGDVSAQVSENYMQNQTRPAGEKLQLKLNWRRVGVFTFFGTIIAGPAFHYWFGYLDQVPAAYLKLRNHHARSQVFKAYSLLKKHGFDITLDISKVPDSKPLSIWVEKGIKIALDQLVFSSIYTFVFFVSTGVMQGGVDKLIADSHEHSLDDHESLMLAKQRAAIARRSESLEKELLALKGTATVQAAAAAAGAAGAEGASSESQESIDRVLRLLREERAKHAPLTWQSIWEHTIEHTKKVYLATYAADCIVWPPLQLINFTFVPLQYRVLYVNVCNLAWNTFLSLQANKTQ